MPSAVSRYLRSFCCFRQRTHLDVIDGAPVVVTSYDFNDTKEPCYSSHSINSDIVEKKDLPDVSFGDDAGSSTSTLAATAIEKVSRTNPALLVTAKGVYAFAEDFSYPSLAHGKEVIIRSCAVGLNPIDWMCTEYGFCLPDYPWINGREMAGVVESIGSEVEGLKIGDRVWTSTYYKDRRAGCFQRAVAVPAHTVLPMPTNLSFEESATLGVAGLTAAMTLWKWLQISDKNREAGTRALSTPDNRPNEEYLLIWGGAAITGQFAIQIARLSGIKIICIASAKTAPLCLSLGATHVVARDGKSAEDIIAEIREVAGDSITKAVDLVGAETAGYCLKAVSQTKHVLFAPLAMMSKTASVPENVQVETVEMKRFVLEQENAVYAKKLNDLVQSAQVKVPALKIIDGGFEMIEEGLKRLKNGDRLGKKLVVNVR